MPGVAQPHAGGQTVIGRKGRPAMFRIIRQAAILGTVMTMMMGCGGGEKPPADTTVAGPAPISIGPWIATPDPDFPTGSGIQFPKSTEAININIEMPRSLSNDLRVLAGYSDAIAVGTVTAVNATTERNGVLWTSFTVDILDTLKGEVTSPATVNIIGGYDTHGVLYIPPSDAPTLVGQSYILYLRHAASGEAFQWECVPVSGGRAIIRDLEVEAIKEGRADAVHNIRVLKKAIAQQMPLR